MVTGVENFLGGVATKQHELTDRLDKLSEQKARVQNGYKLGIYTDEEVMKEIKESKEIQRAVELELKNLEGTDVKTEVERQEKIKQKIELLLSGVITDPAKVNKLLHNVIEKIYYWKEKTGNGHETPFTLAIIWK